ncbi:zinc finger, CCHC-type containing protein [Tanacetum coccineum]
MCCDDIHDVTPRVFALAGCDIASDPKTADPETIDKYYKIVNLEQEVACLMSRLNRKLFEICAKHHAYVTEDGQSVSSNLLKMKSYLDTLECLGYEMPNELGVSLILNSLNMDYEKFVQNYNMHSMWKTIADITCNLKLHEKGISKKAETPAVMAIWEGKIQKDKKKLRGAKCEDKGKTKLTYTPKPKIPLPPKRDNSIKDSICHHCNEGLRESRKLKHGALSLYIGNGMCVKVEAIGCFDLILPSGLIIVLDNASFAPTVTRGVVSISHLVNNGYTHTFMNYGISVSKDNVVYFNAIPQDARILNMVPTKKVERTPYEIWHGKAPNLSYLRVWGCEIRKDTSSTRYGFYVDVEEYELGDLNEPPNYKAALSNPEFNKWLEAMNTEMQSMKDNQVWVLVDLLSNGRTIGIKWLFKKKTDMDGNVHTFKARIIAKGYTQTYGVDYGETFSPVADIRAIRIF